ncbi:MAG: prolyl oligopeptidase family serine peptidase [Lentisphaeria bacterium]|nr:prolyl oligopeptidase family serine peptidase [Lentisphaeria bacterium]
MAEETKYPFEISVDKWMGGTRHKISIANSTAWIVEPPCYAEKKQWFWLPEWPTAFPNRNGVKELIQMGFYMLHIDVYGKFANPEAVKIMYTFYEYLQEQGFAEKGAFIGMSMGGLYTFRFLEEYPHIGNCIYADAPVCRLDWRHVTRAVEAEEVSRAYGYGDDISKLENHPLSPVNNYKKMVEHDIPLLMIVGLDDLVVNVQNNGLLMAELWEKAGGKVEVISRMSWGHHPHGLDDPARIIRFILENTFK